MSFQTNLIEAWLSQPLGSLSKRELELLLLRLSMQHELLPSTPAQLARKCNITITKAHAYLTDVALRQEPLANHAALARLAALITVSEVSADGKMLQMSVQDAALRLWLESSLAENGLLQGESLRRDVIKLSPKALAFLLTTDSTLPTPKQALKKLQIYSNTEWYPHMAQLANQGYAWDKVLDGLASAASIAKDVIPLLLQLK